MRCLPVRFVDRSDAAKQQKVRSAGRRLPGDAGTALSLGRRSAGTNDGEDLRLGEERGRQGGQVEFFLRSRERGLGEVEARAESMRRALAIVSAAVPVEWRQGRVERADLDRFLFGPEDVVVVVGQDGLVANVAKYLDAQPVIGVDTDPARNPGVLVRHPPEAVADLLRSLGSQELRTMVEATSDVGQHLRALNEVFVGPASHQTARYTLDAHGAHEAQASSGVVVQPGPAPRGGAGRCGWSTTAS